MSYPRRTEDGGMVWACCKSQAGPVCGHRRVPGARMDYPRRIAYGMTGRTGRHAGPMSEANAVEELRIKLTHPLMERRYGLWTVEDADTGEQLTPAMPRDRAERVAAGTVGRNVRAVPA